VRLNVLGQLLSALVIFFRLAHEGLAKDINFGWPSGEGWSSQPYKAAIEKGFFEKEGLKIRVITMPWDESALIGAADFIRLDVTGVSSPFSLI
jgi:hypothetical protein